MASETIKFLQNHISVGGNRAKVWYSYNRPGHYRQALNEESIVIYAKEYGATCLRSAFDSVVNDTDSQTDYFAKDRVCVTQCHPMFTAVAKAAGLKMLGDVKRADKKARKAGVCAPDYIEGQRKEAEYLLWLAGR